MDHGRGPARSEDVRAHNLAAVAAHLDLVGRASRAELAAVTGLVPGAVSSLVAELREAGLVRPSPGRRPPPDGAGHVPRRGRPTEHVELDGSATGVMVVRFLMGEVEVLGTDLAGRVLHSSRRALQTPVGDAGATAALLADALVPAAADLRAAGARPRSTAVVAPAPVDPRTGHVSFSVDFGWRDVDLAALVRAAADGAVGGVGGVGALGEVVVLNDAEAATHAEARAHRQATGRRADELLYLKADTGVGGGVVLGGRLRQGPGAYGFQPGHTVVVPGGEPCSCGKRGCLVTVAGPDVVLRRAGLDGLVARVGPPAALAELLDRAEAGDPACAEAVAVGARWLRLALVNACMLLQPSVVVLGGYLDRLRDLLLAPGEDGYGPGLPGDPDVVAARHGDASAVQGALAMRRAALLADPASLRP